MKIEKTTGVYKHRGLPLRRAVPSYCCPYCGDPIGYLGRAVAWLFGTRLHGCDARNVMSFGEYTKRLLVKKTT